MNGTYYPNPTFPNNMNNLDSNNNLKNKDLPMEESYIENILRLNKGKIVKVYVSYSDSNDYHDMIYTGKILQAGKDHLVMTNAEENNWYLIPMIYVNWVEFETKPIYSIEYL